MILAVIYPEGPDEAPRDPHVIYSHRLTLQTVREDAGRRAMAVALPGDRLALYGSQVDPLPIDEAVLEGGRWRWVDGGPYPNRGRGRASAHG